MAVSDNSARIFSKQVFRVYKPNTGLQSKTETLVSVKEKSKKVTSEEAQEHWTRVYEESAIKCSHEIWLGKCGRTSTTLTCHVGLRKRIYHILSGSVLSLWDTIEKTLPNHLQSKLQIVRLKMQDDKIIGKFVIWYRVCQCLTSLLIC